MPGHLIVILVLSGIGIINTLYLSYHTVTKTPVKCPFFPPQWCRTVQHSKFSKMLGIPNSFAGLGIYLAVFILALLNAQGIVSFTPIAAIVGIGFLFSVYFTAIQVFVLKALCTWCVVSAVDLTALLAIVLAVKWAW
jgi:uncharacterized membrane protein